MHEKGKSPEGEPSPGANALEDEQGLEQSREALLNPICNKTGLTLLEQAWKQAPE